MEVRGASSINISRSYQSEQRETVKEGAAPVTLYEATTVLRDIADHISRQGSINVPYPDEQQQRWNARYAASQDIASDMELMLACEPHLCVVYYTTTSKPAGLMILDKEGCLDGYEISGMITDFTEKGIGKILTEYAVNISYSEYRHDGQVYLKAPSLGSQEIFRSMGFKDENEGFLFLNPRENDKWEFRDNKWSLKADHTLSQPIIEGEKDPATGGNKLDSSTPFTFDDIVKIHSHPGVIVNGKDKTTAISPQIKTVIEKEERRKKKTTFPKIKFERNSA